MNEIDLLLLIRREDARDTIENSVKKIIGDHNMDEYKKWKADKTKRIAILVDGFDEMNTTINNELLSLSDRKECNVMFLMSTRRHKTDEIVTLGEKRHLWNVIRCLGIQNTAQLFETLSSGNKEKIENIRIALEKNNLQHNPLFMLIAWEIYSKRTLSSENFDMYTLMDDFCGMQFNKYYDAGTLKKERLEQFYTTLGFYAVKSDAVEPIETIEVEGTKQPFTTALEQITQNNKLRLMDIEEMYVIGCNVGFLSVVRKTNDNELKYTFMHKTVAEFAVARLLYNTKLWTVADSLHEDKWSMIHYYLLMHSIHANHNNDNELWKYQLTYASIIDFHDKGNISLYFTVNIGQI
jgi:hypothetical protein